MRALENSAVKYVLPWLLCAIMVVLNVGLVVQNLRMRSLLQRTVPTTIEDGARVKGFTGFDLSHRPAEVTYTGQGPSRVLLFLSPTCPFTKEQLPYWTELIRKGDRERFAVTALVSDSVSADSVRSYLRTNAIDQSVDVVFVPESVMKDYKLIATPITLVISNDGTVRKHWMGKWDNSSLSAASEFFGVSFSGVTAMTH